MKRTFLASLFVLSVGLIAGQAQTQLATFKAQVPFSFAVGNQILPAGTYQVQRLLGRPGVSDMTGLIVLRSTYPHAYKALVTHLSFGAVTSVGASQLVFTTYAGRHYLSEVRISGETTHQVTGLPQGIERASAHPSEAAVAFAELH
jgi:hypothetical protein